MLTRVLSNCIRRNLEFIRLYSSFSFPDIDVGYYCNPNNLEEIDQNIRSRKGIGDVNKVLDAYNRLKAVPETDKRYAIWKDVLYKELGNLPNKTHPRLKDKLEPTLVTDINKKRHFGEHEPYEFSEITRLLNLMRTTKLGHTCGHKSYYFWGGLAELEEALIKYTVDTLLPKGFQFISVPDILSSDILSSCGMIVNSDRTQIYSLDSHHHGPDLYLSGTAEMSLAGLLRDTVHPKSKLPIKLAAVSRCYRAETSNILEERGIYRVHQFTKVEMFVVSTPEESDNMLEVIRMIQEELFKPMGFYMKVLDMPPHELGAPAYRKYDIEAFMPGRKTFGEISSCSNCTDYQSRRLNIKYHDKSLNYVHTLNGTACAVPRMLIALLETHQDPKGKIFIPDVLQPYMNGKKFITKNKSVPELKLLKIRR